MAERVVLEMFQQVPLGLLPQVRMPPDAFCRDVARPVGGPVLVFLAHKPPLLEPLLHVIHVGCELLVEVEAFHCCGSEAFEPHREAVREVPWPKTLLDGRIKFCLGRVARKR